MLCRLSSSNCLVRTGWHDTDMRRSAESKPSRFQMGFHRTKSDRNQSPGSTTTVKRRANMIVTRAHMSKPQLTFCCQAGHKGLYNPGTGHPLSTAAGSLRHSNGVKDSSGIGPVCVIADRFLSMSLLLPTNSSTRVLAATHARKQTEQWQHEQTSIERRAFRFARKEHGFKHGYHTSLSCAQTLAQNPGRPSQLFKRLHHCCLTYLCVASPKETRVHWSTHGPTDSAHRFPSQALGMACALRAAHAWPIVPSTILAMPKSPQPRHSPLCSLSFSRLRSCSRHI